MDPREAVTRIIRAALANSPRHRCGGEKTDIMVSVLLVQFLYAGYNLTNVVQPQFQQRFLEIGQFFPASDQQGGITNTGASIVLSASGCGFLISAIAWTSPWTIMLRSRITLIVSCFLIFRRESHASLSCFLGAYCKINFQRFSRSCRHVIIGQSRSSTSRMPTTSAR
jgi:hypothetical protein